jgi:hypothetical protein
LEKKIGRSCHFKVKCKFKEWASVLPLFLHYKQFFSCLALQVNIIMILLVKTTERTHTKSDYITASFYYIPGENGGCVRGVKNLGAE